jgi:hypothetical protein
MEHVILRLLGVAVKNNTVMNMRIAVLAVFAFAAAISDEMAVYAPLEVASR